MRRTMGTSAQTARRTRYRIWRFPDFLRRISCISRQSPWKPKAPSCERTLQRPDPQTYTYTIGRKNKAATAWIVNPRSVEISAQSNPTHYQKIGRGFPAPPDRSILLQAVERAATLRSSLTLFVPASGDGSPRSPRHLDWLPRMYPFWSILPHPLRRFAGPFAWFTYS